VPSYTITFDDQAALASLPDRGASTFAGFAGHNYTEHDVTFKDGVDPPDARLAHVSYNHYHLVYEDPTAFERMLDPSIPPSQRPDPVQQPRHLGSMGPDHDIQLTYDPNHDGVPDPFDLTGIAIVSGTMDVGIMYANGEIAVFNNLGPGSYALADAHNIVRATLEGNGTVGVDSPYTVGSITIDNVW
jgi:hypothetical protein